MSSRDRFLPVFLLALAFAAPAVASAQEKNQKQTAKGEDDNPYLKRFQQLDSNRDGFVSLPEWPLEPASFHRVDRNQDGRLSRTELLTPNVLRRDRRDEQFHELDTNRDGRLSRTERQPQGTILDRLDRDRDGFVTRPEYGTLENTWSSRATPEDQLRFRNIDRNRDNLLSRLEWTGDPTRFLHLDRNQDGVISPNEWPRP
jgi:Ca2+-binding EF-hand superfamily protein